MAGSQEFPPRAHVPVSGRVLYEDNHFIAVCKEVGELVQGDATRDVPLVESVQEFLRVRDSKPGRAFVQVAHRIDRPVAGVVLLAKTSKGLSRFNALLRDGTVRRVYWAVTEHPPADIEGVLEGYIIRNARLNKSFVCAEPRPGAKRAETRYRLLGQSDRYSLLEVELRTGRHHQIRAQLAHVGCPIRGDLKYGARRSLPGGGISLFARELAFLHPITGAEIRIIATPPSTELWPLFETYQ